MTRFRIPRTPALRKDYTKCPWIGETRTERPTEVARQFIRDGIKPDKLLDKMFLEMHYDRQKSDLLCQTIKEQGHIVKNDNEVILTINIPFCVSRCFNCKRVMCQINKSMDILPYYYEALLKEINLTREIIQKNCYIVKAVCYTGNLLALDLAQMERILSITAYSFSQTCVEVGHPSLITLEKLQLLKKYNVNRIILNALTFNMSTLRKLCRKYDFKDFYASYRLIASLGFETNIRLVAGLFDEHQLQLKRNLQIAIELGATNIDISVRSCPYNMEELAISDETKIVELRKMLEFVYKFMIEKKYFPYYVYLTEIEKGCFENVGYTINDKGCVYLTDKIEQISTTLGCGTSAENMRVKNLHNEKTFYCNTYDVGQYILGIDEYLDKKKKFFT